MSNYKLINNIFGWVAFLIAAITYTITLEPTASFWDCGEFIAAAYKLQVVHQPGAPLFLMIVRIFTLLAGSDTSQIAYFANFSSGLVSASTILFLFWTISAFARKMVINSDGDYTTGNIIAIMGSAMVGALAYTWSDTFWFSAVEAEVYAMSSLCTAVVMWAILKWENESDAIHADKWLIFIAYLMGLSIGVHLLNLLAIPALAFVYYFKKYKSSRTGIIKTGLLSVLILGFVQYGVIPGVVSLAATFDLAAVNGIGLPFGSGVILFGILLVGSIVFGLSYSVRKNLAILNTAILCLSFIIIGYSSYAMIIIRAKANTVLNNSSPDNVYSFLGYLNREQYGDRPLLYGQNFTAKVIDEKEGGMMYRKGDKRYEEIGRKRIQVFEKNQQTLLPRIFSTQQSSHVNFYKSWLNIPAGKSPTFADNISFLFTYQIGYMYLRYFMWNFAGRQNDIQGIGNSTEGNWISGIKPLDAMRLGNQDNLPPSISENKANNKLYFLPLILGIVGLAYHFRKKQKDAVVVALLFFFTGLAIVLYLNQTPYQPRERDYAYAGSFYAFTIWIGLGVLALFDYLRKNMNGMTAAGLATAICLVSVPGLMAKVNFDDHDRSNRTIVRDLASNYLNSCAPNAILFTMGDNDTYPLWYAQEVEGIRKDVRLVNLSLLGTDWYINQHRLKMNDSEGIPISYPANKIVTGLRDYVPFYDMKINGYADLKEVVDFMGSDNREAQLQTRNGDFINFLPTKKLSIAGTGPAGNPADTLSPDRVRWDLKKDGLFKNDLMVLDIIANNKWKRPIYFAVTIGSDNFFGLEDYFEVDGLAYRLVPTKANNAGRGVIGKVNTSAMYDNVMNKFKWGNLNGNVYVDPESARMTTVLKNYFYQLASQLMVEGKKDSAIKVLAKSEEVLPVDKQEMNTTILDFQMAEIYYQAKMPAKANGLLTRAASHIEGDLNYYHSLKGKKMQQYSREIQYGLSIMQELSRISKAYNQPAVSASLEKRYKELETKLR